MIRVGRYLRNGYSLVWLGRKRRCGDTLTVVRECTVSTFLFCVSLLRQEPTKILS